MKKQELVNLIDELENQTYNLCLYLDYVRENHPLVYENLETMFDGMPGYVPGSIEQEKQ